MTQILSQDEVDALLQGISDGDVETESAPAPEEQVRSIQDFDFTNQDRIVRGSLPTLEMIHDRFARSFRTSISNATHRSADVTAQGQEMVKFGEFMRHIPMPSSLHIFKLEPLKGLAICILEGKLIFSLLDHFFGGRGKGSVKLDGRDFTPIEQRIIKMVVKMILDDYYDAWHPVHDVKIEYMSSEINPQFVNVVPNSDLVVSVVMEVELEEETSQLRFCLPYSMLEPIKEKLKAGFQSSSSDVDSAVIKRLRQHLREIPVDIRVNLASTQLKGREVMSLQVGDIIPLKQDPQTPLVVNIENIPKLLGFLGQFRGNNALKIEGPINIPK